jgi:hypothetical protein
MLFSAFQVAPLSVFHFIPRISFTTFIYPGLFIFNPFRVSFQKIFLCAIIEMTVSSSLSLSLSKSILLFSPSHYLPFSLSPLLSVSPSLRLSVSPSLRLSVSQSLRLSVSLFLFLPFSLSHIHIFPLFTWCFYITNHFINYLTRSGVGRCNSQESGDCGHHISSAGFSQRRPFCDSGTIPN